MEHIVVILREPRWIHFFIRSHSYLDIKTRELGHAAFNGDFVQIRYLSFQ
ncbi:hypothetical protein B0I21_102281 [Sphingobacterium paludis]|uniref:Uncharacterized protein n=1 Tax=Sphingobacterium paludis TaxID=1476465 RepID=A0A4R7D832_9SPHI|nr:hypothetical protein B0I21_102281 [Sphingobacterium paludis]